MLLLLLGYFSTGGGPTTPSGTGGVAVVSSERLYTVKTEPTTTVKSEKIGTVSNG